MYYMYRTTRYSMFFLLNTEIEPHEGICIPQGKTEWIPLPGEWIYFCILQQQKNRITCLSYDYC